MEGAKAIVVSVKDLVHVLDVEGLRKRVQNVDIVQSVQVHFASIVVGVRQIVIQTIAQTQIVVPAMSVMSLQVMGNIVHHVMETMYIATNVAYALITDMIIAMWLYMMDIKNYAKAVATDVLINIT